MISMFQTIKLEGNWWAVFLVNGANPKDRYMLTAPLDKQKDADHFRDEFIRIAGLQ